MGRNRLKVSSVYKRAAILRNSRVFVVPYMTAQDEASQHSSMEQGEAQESRLVFKELLAGEGFWVKRSHSSINHTVKNASTSMRIRVAQTGNQCAVSRDGERLMGRSEG